MGCFPCLLKPAWLSPKRVQSSSTSYGYDFVNESSVDFWQIGVIKALKNSIDASKEITALWVTHRLEELEYADGAIYMEDGRIIMQNDASIVYKFIEARRASYLDQINL